MMKRKSLGFYKHRKVSITLVLLALVFFLASSAQAKKITLRYASYNPPRGMGAQTAIWLMDEITKRSEGQVAFQHYFGGTLIKARETLRGVQQGTADMGYLFVPYFPKELRVWTVAETFVRGPASPKKRGAYFWDLYEQIPEMEKQLAQWNQKVLAIRVFGKLAVGGPTPIKSLEDLKNLRVRCSGGYDAQHMSDLEAKIVFLKGSEVYSAMQKGAVDANYTALTSYFKYRLYEIGDNHHLLVLPQFSGSIGLITMNLKKWNSLPADLQKLISDVGKEYSQVQHDKILELEKEYRDKMKSAGCKIFEASSKEIQAWGEVTEGPSKAKWIKGAEEQGIANAKDLFGKAEKLISEYKD